MRATFVTPKTPSSSLSASKEVCLDGPGVSNVFSPASTGTVHDAVADAHSPLPDVYVSPQLHTIYTHNMYIHQWGGCLVEDQDALVGIRPIMIEIFCFGQEGVQGEEFKWGSVKSHGQH